MTQYGLTPAGFIRKPFEQILADIEARQRATIAEDIDQSEGSLLHQMNVIKAQELDEAWRALEAVHNSSDPSKASGAALVNLSKLTGTDKRGASYSTVPVTVTLDEGTPLESGVHFAASNEATPTRWTPAEDFTAPSTGPHAVTFRAETKGPVDAPSGSITVIATPVTGWTSVTSGDVTLGRPVDDDDTLRERREAQIEAAGAATLRSLVADLLEICDAARVLENVGSTMDAEGVPPQSFEAVVLSTSTNDQIAQVIYDNGHTGIPSHGSLTGTATDEDGGEHVERFSRVEERDVYLEFDLEVGDGFDANVFKAALALQADEEHDVGDSVKRARINTLAINSPNVEDVVAIRLGFASSPTGTVNLPINVRQIARFDAARILVNEV